MIKLLASTGAVIDEVIFPTASDGGDIVSDGTNIWVSEPEGIDPDLPYANTVTKISPASISPAGIVPLDSQISTIQSGEWVSIYGSNFASGTAVWNGNFPTSPGGTSVSINGKAAYLSLVSPGQINLQAPDDTATGTVSVTVSRPNIGGNSLGGTVSSTVTVAQFAPSFSLLDAKKHVAGIILRPDGSGAYGGGTYDILGPT